MTLFFFLITLFPHKLAAFAFGCVFVTHGIFFFLHDCLIYCKDDLCRNVILVYCFVVPDVVAQGLQQEAGQCLLQLVFAVAMMAACSFFAHHTPSLPFQTEGALQVDALSFRLPSSHCSLTT